MGMITLRLFRQTDPFRPLESRTLDEGELSIGRAPGEGWTIEDPERALSRQHCVIALREGQLSLCDTSANGVFVGADRKRAPAGQPTPIAAGETLRLGDFLIVVDAPADPTLEAPRGEAPAAGTAFDAPFTRPILQPGPVDEAALAAPTDWAQPTAAAEAPSDGSLLEAFCAGARLDASAFAGEEPGEVMRRLGGVYQQMVLGLADLMSERTSVKAEYRLDRTTVRAEGNNPFRWAPAQRVAVDLLRVRDDGFLSGRQAVTASFEDLKTHLLCMLAGLRAAVGATFDGLAPEAAEEALKGQSFVLKNRAQAAWAEYQRLYAEFRARADDDPDSPINQAFRAAYQDRLRELDAMGGQT